MTDRTALVVLAGDVGTGKTELAETSAIAIARDLGVKVTLFPLSLSARGHGAVGEMTTLLTQAFETCREQATGGRGRDGRLRHATILLVDEADALAQSRELAQMHHEDRAGVNALIRGIDGLRNERLPVLTIMCTNRIDAIDPAVRRRAAAIFEFTRPDDDGPRGCSDASFHGVAISDADMAEIVRLTGPRDGRATAARTPTCVSASSRRRSRGRGCTAARSPVSGSSPSHELHTDAAVRRRDGGSGVMSRTADRGHFDLTGAFFKRQEKLRSDLGLGDIAAHPGTKGDDTELNWLHMLERVPAPPLRCLPRRSSSTRRVTQSEQIDVVIHDRHFSPLLFEVGDACYIPAESVYAAFEVKQDLDKGNLEYAADKIATVRSLHRTTAPVPHAGGMYDPITRAGSSAGCSTRRSDWTPPFGEPFETCLQDLDARDGGEVQWGLDIGCAVEDGGFTVTRDATTYAMQASTTARRTSRSSTSSCACSGSCRRWGARRRSTTTPICVRCRARRSLPGPRRSGDGAVRPNAEVDPTARRRQGIGGRAAMAPQVRTSRRGSARSCRGPVAGTPAAGRPCAGYAGRRDPPRCAPARASASGMTPTAARVLVPRPARAGGR